MPHIEGQCSEFCMEKQGVDQGRRTTIGHRFVLLMHDSPMVERWAPFYPERCSGLCYYRPSASVFYEIMPDLILWRKVPHPPLSERGKG